jgi:hypothetical protein
MKGGEQDENKISNNSGNNLLFRYFRNLYIHSIRPRGPQNKQGRSLGDDW